MEEEFYQKNQRSVLTEKISALFSKYERILLFTAKDLNAKQLLLIKRDLKGKGEIVIQKSTKMIEAAKNLSCKIGLADEIQRIAKDDTNVDLGLIFTKKSFLVIKDIICTQCSIETRPGVKSPVDIYVYPTIIQFNKEILKKIQKFGIPHKCDKECIKIISFKQIVKKNDIINKDMSFIINNLGIYQSNCSKIVEIYEKGQFFDARSIYTTDDDIAIKINNALNTVRALSVGIDYVNPISLPYFSARYFIENKKVQHDEQKEEEMLIEQKSEEQIKKNSDQCIIEFFMNNHFLITMIIFYFCFRFLLKKCLNIFK